jgi:hypothetical protein
MSMKNSNDTIGNRTRKFRTCSAVPQPTAPPAACPTFMIIYRRIIQERLNNEGNLLKVYGCHCWASAILVYLKADSHIACRAHAVPLPCRADKGLECGFPIWFWEERHGQSMAWARHAMCESALKGCFYISLFLPDPHFIFAIGLPRNTTMTKHTNFTKRNALSILISIHNYVCDECVRISEIQCHFSLLTL